MSEEILIIGNTNVDFLIKGERLPAVGETVTDRFFMQNLSGKGANQAIGAARAGGKVIFVTCLEDDKYADKVIMNFEKEGICTSFVSKEKGSDTGSTLAPAHIEKAFDVFKIAGIIVLQMEIPLKTIDYVFNLAEIYHKKVMFNLAPARLFDLSFLKNLYVFVLNEAEAATITGLKVETDTEIETAAADLLSRGPKIVIINLGVRGSFVATAELREFMPAFKVIAVDKKAAEDVYCGSLAVALVEGKPISEAVRFALAASAISGTRSGAQPSAPRREEIEEFLRIENCQKFDVA